MSILFQTCDPIHVGLSEAVGFGCLSNRGHSVKAFWLHVDFALLFSFKASTTLFPAVDRAIEGSIASVDAARYRAGENQGTGGSLMCAPASMYVL